MPAHGHADQAAMPDMSGHPSILASLRNSKGHGAGPWRTVQAQGSTWWFAAVLTRPSGSPRQPPQTALRRSPCAVVSYCPVSPVVDSIALGRNSKDCKRLSSHSKRAFEMPIAYCWTLLPIDLRLAHPHRTPDVDLDLILR